MMIDNKELQEYIDDMRVHLEYVFSVTQQMQTIVNEKEGDSDLFRKFAFYLTPNVNHWINGLQAGSLRDLENVLNERETVLKKKK